MILVDTNVVSETMRAAPDPRVIDWLDAQASETLYFSTVSLAEILYGVAVLPEGRRKIALGIALVERAGFLFGERILPFDVAAANSYATLASRVRRHGNALGVADGQIAAIAATQGFAVATRDVAPFQAAGVATINPWAL